MSENAPPRPSAVLIGFALIVIGSCVYPVGVGLEAQRISDPITNWLGLILIATFGSLAFAQYVAVFRKSRFFSSVAICLLVTISLLTFVFVLLMFKAATSSNDAANFMLPILACMCLVYACTVVLTYRWQTELINAKLSQCESEPAKNLRLFDLFAITSFTAGVVAYLASVF